MWPEPPPKDSSKVILLRFSAGTVVCLMRPTKEMAVDQWPRGTLGWCEPATGSAREFLPKTAVSFLWAGGWSCAGRWQQGSQCDLSIFLGRKQIDVIFDLPSRYWQNGKVPIFLLLLVSRSGAIQVLEGRCLGSWKEAVRRPYDPCVSVLPAFSRLTRSSQRGHI